MAVTYEEVRSALEPDEPNYEAARQLGREAVPHLERLVAGDNPLLAAKAAYLASLIGGEDAHAVVAGAAASEHPTVRVSASAAARNLPAEAVGNLLVTLIQDEDAGVRHAALRAVPPEASPELLAHVERVAEGEAGAGPRAAAPEAFSPPTTGKGGGPVPLPTPATSPGAVPVVGKGGGVLQAGGVAAGKGGGSIRLGAPALRAPAVGKGGGDLGRPRTRRGRGGGDAGRADGESHQGPEGARTPHGREEEAAEAARRLRLGMTAGSQNPRAVNFSPALPAKISRMTDEVSRSRRS